MYETVDLRGRGSYNKIKEAFKPIQRDRQGEIIGRFLSYSSYRLAVGQDFFYGRCLW